ncbi:MAG TPA: hypothetical protein VFO25_08045 [Candidatus Eremiobacteraceae bacterium]|nr:hypothetical protein [Candidatus Eremiobacteraceae bacterium]
MIIATIAVVAVVATSAVVMAHRSAAESPSTPQRQYEQSLDQQLRWNSDFRANYAIHVRMMDLFDRFPTFDRANFGPGVRVVYWRSVKWVIKSVYQDQNGNQIVHLSYGGGPGIDEDYTARLVNGRYDGHLKVDWASLARDPRFADGFAPWNSLHFVCRDVRSNGSTLAVAPLGPGGPTITKAQLSEATEGVSDLAGTSVGCYKFAGRTLVGFSHETTGVLFQMSNGMLVPLVRGNIALSDSRGSFLVVAVSSGYTENDLQQTDYLEAFAPR